MTTTQCTPDVTALVAPEPVPVWEAMEAALQRRLPPPFWAHVWPGSLALARWVSRQQVRGVRVLDFGCGGGVAGIAAARAGARVTLNDIDPLALEVAAENARLNGVEVALEARDLLGSLPDAGLVLVGDVFYEAPLARAVSDWLDALCRRGVEVMVGDPGRQFLPTARLTLVERAEVACVPAWDSVTDRPASVWRWSAP